METTCWHPSSLHPSDTRLKEPAPAPAAPRCRLELLNAALPLRLEAGKPSLWCSHEFGNKSMGIYRDAGVI